MTESKPENAKGLLGPSSELTVSESAPQWVEDVLKKHKIDFVTGTVTVDDKGNVFLDGIFVGNRKEIEKE